MKWADWWPCSGVAPVSPHVRGGFEYEVGHTANYKESPPHRTGGLKYRATTVAQRLSLPSIHFLFIDTELCLWLFQMPPRGGRLCHSANAFPIWRIIDSDHQVVAHDGRTTTAMAGEFSPPPLLGKHFDLSRNSYSSCCYCSKLQFGITHTLFPNSRRTANSETTSETAAHSDPAQPSLRPSADRMPRSRSSPHCPCKAPPAE